MMMASSLFLISSFLFLSYVNCDCSFSNCTNFPQSYSYNLYSIPFPFSTPDQPRICGLPGFELGCNVSNATPLLSFPNGDVFTVEYISNYSSQIKVSNVCLQEKLMSFNSSGTPFVAEGFTEFALFTCPSSVRVTDIPFYYRCEEIKCTKNIVCELSVNHSNWIDNGCHFVGNVNVAGIWYSASQFNSLNSTYLNWEKPLKCKLCDPRREVCRRDSYNYTYVKCFPQVRADDKDLSTKLVFIILSIMAFITTCVFYLRRRQLQSLNLIASTVVGNTTTLQTHTNQGSNATSGLEQATLNTFPIVQVGDSGRVLINMEDKACPICLSDYEPRHIIKLLPECLHKFHSDCIDEWLRAKTVCPICRTTLPQTSF